MSLSDSHLAIALTAPRRSRTRSKRFWLIRCSIEILTAPEEDLHLRQIMDEGKILLVNLAKGHVGEDSSSLLGGLVVTTIGLAAFSRADTPQDKRRDFFVYVDEFQRFTTVALANMFFELRKYRVGFTVAYQYLNQLTPEVRHAILGNVGSIISFRVGVEMLHISFENSRAGFRKSTS
ncbi:type IV secretory system conjugative DNA transfer family protein [Bradyrhizobium sp. CCGB20]|uniref:type IV secretory system conjugative DNA transfer family protein n=1 Tax=Bradyrhizobium sp. CCGB20 TaxID=2949633 RepID=UPI0020B27E51|nr:type IV secretory system conjugative DNA transfer family protein [Bradyrhizobium sp. CCGB20]MCP3396934.1 type IV secretory system conjugative DNA transfer family protein [Bradyrhizobium sp. CCGB20]